MGIWVYGMHAFDESIWGPSHLVGIWIICYRLDKRLKGLVVGATYLGSAVHMMRASYTSRVSVRGLVSGHRLSRSNLLGYLNHVSG